MRPILCGILCVPILCGCTVVNVQIEGDVGVCVVLPGVAEVVGALGVEPRATPAVPGESTPHGRERDRHPHAKKAPGS